MNNFQHPLFDEVYFYEKLISTSRQAEKLIKEQTAQGNFLVLANEQSSGSGRGKNTWFSPVGGIWLTAAIYGLSVQSNLTIFTGIAIHRALSEIYPEISDNLKIKWPNDIYWQERKLCGILASHDPAGKYHLLGIGLNTNIRDFPIDLSAVSLAQILQQEIDHDKLMARIFDFFAADLPQFIEEGLDVHYFGRYSLLTGKEIVLETDFDRFAGICRGINRNGAILIELKSGMIQPFFAGSVTEWTRSED